jgi:uncharacterized membrane protein
MEKIQAHNRWLDGGKVKTQTLFVETVTEKIWHNYFRRVNRCSKALETHQQKELVLEIQDHLLESFKQETGTTEADRLLDAIEKMGAPEEFIKPLVADKLLGKAVKTFNPKTVLKGLFYYLSISIRNFLLGILFTIGYITAVGMALMALLKPFFPHHVGLNLYKNGDFVLGIDWDITGSTGEVMGFWVIPVCTTLAVLIYFGLTRLLKLLRNGVAPQPSNPA